MNKVSFVFSTDDSYAMPTAIAIKSLVNHNENSIKNIFVLFKGSLKDQSVSMLKTASKPLEISFIDVGDRIKYTYDKIPHITSAAYYRMLIPELLPNESRCLYLDGDILVRGSLQDLISLPLDETIFTVGVRCPAVANSLPSTIRKHSEELEIPNLLSYINSGVQLMNLDSMRKNDLVRKMIDLIPKNYSIQDQDIYNKVCFDHIKLVSPTYNCTTYMFELSNHSLKKAYSKDWISEAKINPIIVHYASSSKPWKNTGMPFQEEWDDTYFQLFGSLLRGRTPYKKTTFMSKVFKRLFKR